MLNFLRVFKTFNLKTVIIVFGLQLFFSTTVLAEALPEFPYSKEMSVLIVAEEMVINGIPMKAYQFTSNKDESEIVKFYKQEWGDEMTDILFGDWRILSHRDGDHLFTVQIEQNKTLLTHGTLSVSPLFGMVEDGKRSVNKIAKSIGEDFPLPSGSEIINDILSNDNGRKTRTVLFSNKRSVSQNVSFFDSRMVTKGGWAKLPTKLKKSTEAGALALSKGGSEFNLSVTKQDGITYAVAVSIQ